VDEKDQGKKEGTERSRDEEGSRDRKGMIIETASLFV